MAISIGTRLTSGDETYKVIDLLKEGGFGKAFLAERTSATSPSPSKVVIKVPADHVLADPVWSKKFAREARILANISHRNVVKIIAFWAKIGNSNEQALVQELVTGASELTEFIKNNPDAAPSLLLQTLYGLRAFHTGTSPSAIHRDLSPRNILVSETGVVKIIDFGLAKEDPRATQILTVKGEAFGTPGCMSPEQLTDAASVDHRTDLFATGRSFAAALQERHPQVARPEKLAEPWRTICSKLTEDNPDDRPATAEAALSHAMECFAASGTPIEHFGIHAKEMHRQPVISGWPGLCHGHLARLGDFDQAAIRLMWRFDGAVFSHPCDANALLDRIEASSAIQAVEKGLVDFDDGDPLGELYARLYPYLDVRHRLVCFARICRTAILLHRYSVMADVRVTYGLEKNEGVRAQLMAVLGIEDPDGTIHGRGIIPRDP